MNKIFDILTKVVYLVLQIARALQIPQTAGRMNKWVLEQIKPETSLEAKMTKPKLSYFGQGSLEKTVMLEKIEGSRKRGRPTMRWTDSTKEAVGISQWELSRAARTGRWGCHSLTGSPKLELTLQHNAHVNFY